MRNLNFENLKNTDKDIYETVMKEELRLWQNNILRRFLQKGNVPTGWETSKFLHTCFLVLCILIMVAGRNGSKA